MSIANSDFSGIIRFVVPVLAGKTLDSAQIVGQTGSEGPY